MRSHRTCASRLLRCPQTRLVRRYGMRGPAPVGMIAVAGCPPPPRAPARGEQVMAFSVITIGRRAGDAEIRIEPDGTRLGHYAYNDRGRGPDTRTSLIVDAAGAPRRFRVTGVNYLKAPVDERLDDDAGMLRWQSSSDRGQAAAGAG